jgi:integrase
VYKQNVWLGEEGNKRYAPRCPRGSDSKIPFEILIRLAACRKSQNLFLYKICVVALYTALRKGSLFALTTANTDIVNGIISLPTSKTGNPVTLPLVGEALEIVRELHATTEDGFLFPRSPGNPWSHYRKSWEFALKRAHLEDTHFHDLRRSSASYLIQAGVDIYTVSRILTHADVSTTQIYAHLHTDNLRDAMRVLADRLAK